MNFFPQVSRLIPALKSGNRSAWNELSDESFECLLNKARSLLNSSSRSDLHSSDLVQETLLKAWNRRETFQGDNTIQLAGWLRKILRNTFIDHCRKPKREVQLSNWFGFYDQSETPSACLLAGERERQLLTCLAALDAQHQRILCLRHLQGLKFQEISTVTGLNINTVAGQYRRGLKELKLLLEIRQAFETR